MEPLQIRFNFLRQELPKRTVIEAVPQGFSWVSLAREEFSPFLKNATNSPRLKPGQPCDLLCGDGCRGRGEDTNHRFTNLFKVFRSKGTHVRPVLLVAFH